MKSNLKNVANILLFVSSVLNLVRGFTYDDEYAELNRDNYGFDLSELQHVSAEQPKYNTMIKGYTRGPVLEEPKKFAQTNEPCDISKYTTYLKPIHMLKTSYNADTLHQEIHKMTNEFLNNGEKKSSFTWKEVCFHMVNALYCAPDGKCKCLEVHETKYYGLKESKTPSYDPYTRQHYNFCRIQKDFGCVPPKSKLSMDTLLCDDGLFCSKVGLCLPDSASSQKANRLVLITMLVVTVFTKTFLTKQ